MYVAVKDSELETVKRDVEPVPFEFPRAAVILKTPRKLRVPPDGWEENRKTDQILFACPLRHGIPVAPG